MVDGVCARVLQSQEREKVVRSNGMGLDGKK
jgi:hypothetical protein